MKQINKILALALTTAVVGCNGYEFDKEQYKNEMYLQSSGASNGYVYDSQVIDLGKDNPVVNVVVGMSGTQPHATDLKMVVMEHDSLFNAYNKSNFDIEKDRYAKKLPQECYSIDSYETTLKAGTFRALIPIKLANLDVLNPDSTYMLDFKVDSLKSGIFNHKQFKEVLIPIYKKNEFASTKTATYYNYTTTTIVTPNASGSAEVRRPTNSNRVFPLTKNSVRLMAGAEELGDYKKALPNIETKSIILEIEEKPTDYNALARHLTIKPYKTANNVKAGNFIDVVQLTPIDDYDNTYLHHILTTPDGKSTHYKEFRLHYKYRLSKTDPYKEVKGILRLQFNPRAEQL